MSSFSVDFDSQRVSKSKSSKGSNKTVRMMTPFSMKCTSCGEFIYKGKKFNARKEGTNENYLGIKIITLNFRCPRCANKIVIKTDPKNADYKAESGAIRNSEPWRDREKEEETVEERLARLEREGQTDDALKEKDALAELEKRAQDSVRQMQALDELDLIRHRNAKVESLKLASGGILAVETDAEDAKDDAEEVAMVFTQNSSGETVRLSNSGPAKELPPSKLPIFRKKPKKNLLGVKQIKHRGS